MTMSRVISLAAGVPCPFYSPLLPLPITEEEAATILKTRFIPAPTVGRNSTARQRKNNHAERPVFSAGIFT